MKRKRKWVFPVVSILLIAFLVALPTLIERSRGETGEMTVFQAKAERNSIDKTLSGTGTLEEQDSEVIELPSGVEVTKYLVSNGDMVKKDQPLVTVDRVSVQEAISSCQATMDHIQEQMLAIENSQSVTRYINAPATGTVKAIYCEKGDKVSDVMLEHGCLAILEIGGKEWKVQEYSGKVIHVNVKEGQTVHARDMMFWVDEIASATEYDTLHTQHQEYEDLMSRLFVMYRDGVISAPCDGKIGDIDKDEVKKVQDVEDTAAELLAQVKAEQADHRTDLKDLPENFDPSSLPGFPGDFEPPEGGFGSFGDFGGSEGFRSSERPERPEGSEPRKRADVPIYASGASALRSGKNVIRIVPLTYEGEKLDRIPAEKTSEGSLFGSGEAPSAEYVLGTVVDQNGTMMISFGNEQYFVSEVNMNGMTVSDGDEFVFIRTTDGGSGTNTYAAVYQTASGAQKKAAQEQMQQMQQEMQQQMQEQMQQVMQEQMQQMMQQYTAQAMQQMMSSQMGMMSGMSAAMLAGASASSAEESFDMYPLDGTDIMTVTPQETYQISMTVDELDILSVHPGQEARITIDALPGREYSGTVTEVNTYGTANSAGNSKFSATVEIPVSENLLPGMNASVLITVSTTENVLTLPAKALVGKDGKTLVYTGYDEKNGILTGPVEVTTGASDGEIVEILSGLSEGDSVTYEYDDTVNIDTMNVSSGYSSMFAGLGGGRF